MIFDPGLALLVDFVSASGYTSLYMSVGRQKSDLEAMAKELGASVFGVCEVGELAEGFHPEIGGRSKTLPYAVAIGIEIQPAVLETLEGRPNELYKSHYRMTNSRLDEISFRLAQTILHTGHSALPIPASKVLSRYPMIGHVNHREIAFKAGLGWRGKNNLLVSPQFGSRLRLTTVLTDLRLEADPVSDQTCGRCRACRRMCPAEAIGETPGEFSLEKCREQVARFSKERDFGLMICGLCLNHCPVRAKRNG